MRKLLNNPLFVGFMVVAACLYSAYNFLPKEQPIPTDSESEPPPEIVNENQDSAPIDNTDMLALNTYIEEELQSIEWNTEANARSPFQSSLIQFVFSEDQKEGEDAIEENYYLSAVWEQTNSRFAVVNDRILFPGNQLNNAQVIKIKDSKVWMKHQYTGVVHTLAVGETWTLQLDENGENSIAQ